MTGNSRPLLAFGPAKVQDRPKQGKKPPKLPEPSKPGVSRQEERLTPEFRRLTDAFEAKRAQLREGLPEEVDPALVVVFDLAGSVKDFCNAVDKVDGLEFLSELAGDQTDPDDDFHMIDPDAGRTDKPVEHSLYLVMSNARAIDELRKLFALWKADPKAKLEQGLNKFKYAFEQLTAIRRWGPEDRIRETGLHERWQETLNVIGQSVGTVLVEVELWHRRDKHKRAKAEEAVKNLVADSGGSVLDSAQIAEIGYHALLAELPIQQVESVMTKGAESIRLLAADEIMFVSPFTPMNVAPYAEDPTANVALDSNNRVQGQPRVALLDGLPFQNHDALRGRLSIDDPDGLGDDYPLRQRQHGTAMASLIIHGDLSKPGAPLDRPLYVRPIMRPREMDEGEQVVPNRLFPDLLHRAIKRIVEGDGGHEPAVPSVRVVNLSIGVPNRALTRRMSPIGRLLDWLAVHYNLLFIVSAGNHPEPLTIPAAAAESIKSARATATQAVFDKSLLKGILPPGDAMNVLTVGATHSDNSGVMEPNDAVWDINLPDAPSHYGARGPGVDRSVKPDLHHTGGRSLYVRPVIAPGQKEVALELAPTSATGPGVRVAAPSSTGATNKTMFTFGTSNATALVTREASRLFDVLEAGAQSNKELRLPDPQFHPLLVRALLIHASSWGSWHSHLKKDLGLSGGNARRQLTALLGYGRLDPNKAGTAANNRAVLVAGGLITRDQRHTYELPLPSSLRSKAEWHRFTITLAYGAPTIGHLTRYRGAKVYFTTPDTKLAGGERIEPEHHAVRRGSLQHEIVDGSHPMSFADGDVFPIHIECMDDAQRLHKGNSIRYALVVSVETAERTSTTIYDEVETMLRLHASERARERVQS